MTPTRERRLQSIEKIFRFTREALFAVDAEKNVVLVNDAFRVLTGFPKETGRLLDLRPLLLDPQRKSFPKILAHVTREGNWTGEIALQHPSGPIRRGILSVSKVEAGSDEDVHFVGAITDITFHPAAGAHARDASNFDELTHLPTRKRFQAELARRFDRLPMPAEAVGLAIIDIQRFREINECYSLEIGDSLVKQVASRLCRMLPSEVSAARLGGDEFGLVSSQWQWARHPEQLAERAQALLDEPFVLEGGIELSVSTFAGTSSAPYFANSPGELLRQASTALDQAKAQGIRCVLFSEGLERSARNRQAMEQRLREVIRHGKELEVFFQPQIDIPSRKVVGAEALMRWREAYSGQLIPMNVVIPLAERTGLVAALGEWVLRETCRQGAEWIKEGLKPITLAVNVSAHQMRHGDFPATVRQILDETGYPPHQLELELTESSFMVNMDAVRTKMSTLRAMGVRIALDDFGTGYSSLSHLKAFPVDLLKIDKHFVDDVATQEDGRWFTSTIINMGHALGLRVLAEGVESLQQVEILEMQGCDMYQGYLTSKPVPAQSFTEFLARE